MAATTYNNTGTGTKNPTAGGELQYSDICIDVNSYKPKTNITKVNSATKYEECKYSTIPEANGTISGNVDSSNYINRTSNLDHVYMFGEVQKPNDTTITALKTTDKYRNNIDIASKVKNYVGTKIEKVNTGVVVKSEDYTNTSKDYMNKTGILSSESYCVSGKKITTTDILREADIADSIDKYAGGSISNFNYGVAASTYEGETPSWKDWSTELGADTYIVDNPSNPKQYYSKDKDTYNTGNTLTLSMNSFITSSNPMIVRDLASNSTTQTLPKIPDPTKTKKVEKPAESTETVA